MSELGLSCPKDPLGAVYKDVYGFYSICSVNEHRRESLLILAYGGESSRKADRSVCALRCELKLMIIITIALILSKIIVKIAMKQKIDTHVRIHVYNVILSSVERYPGSQNRKFPIIDMAPI